MKMSLHELDAEIAKLEARIAAERLALDDAINGCTNSLRDTVASPKTLLALTGIGYAMGKMMFGRKESAPAPAAKKAGILGMLTGVAGTAFGLMQPKFGVGMVAKWAAKKAWDRHQANRSAPTAPIPTPVPPRRTPVSTTPARTTAVHK
jgi:hypothetical protein